MNKHNLLKRIASVATELDMKGFTKEAMTMDKVLIRVADINPEEYWDKEWKREFREEEKTMDPTEEIWEYVTSAHNQELQDAVKDGGINGQNFAEFLWDLRDEKLNNMIKNNPALDWSWLDEKFREMYSDMQNPFF
jgi:hypothetical protein